MRIEVTAYHEAGHVIVAWHCRLPHQSVSIKADKTTFGRAIHSNPLRGRNLNRDATLRTYAIAHKLIMICFAGPLAQRRYAPRSHWRGAGEEDNRIATDLACELERSSETATALMQYLKMRTADLVQARWEVIDRFAQVLLEKRELKGKVLNAAITDCYAAGVPGYIPN